MNNSSLQFHRNCRALKCPAKEGNLLKQVAEADFVHFGVFLVRFNALLTLAVDFNPQQIVKMISS